MNCSKVERLISAYLDSELSGVDMLKVKTHLNRCPQCKKIEREIAALKRLLMESPAMTSEADLADQISFTLSESQNSRKQGFGRNGLILFLSCMTVATGIFFASSNHTPQPNSYVSVRRPSQVTAQITKPKISNLKAILEPTHISNRSYYQVSDPLTGPVSPAMYADR